jgi:ATP-binding cassette subfamily C (CFTR/MRP) protein 1
MKVRGGLMGTISDKMMRLRQEKGVDSKVLTLMISDVQKIIGALAYGHELWVAPTETGLATWLLWRQIGPSSLTVLGIALSKYSRSRIGRFITIHH